MKKHTIIGTAGHIDHGKTALIKALTGIDTDRLKEEKQRGITIDIGFAYWQDDVTIIDVPGHEKFIRNMVAGVSTIDFFMLIIAADDGIMPQTIEHLDILNFFNIHDGIVVLNKIDLVDEEWQQLVTDDIRQLMTRYSLTDIPIIPVSAVKGTGIEGLRETLQDKIAVHEQRVSDQPFRLFVDRAITFKGVGTVATGTVLSGQINKGDSVEIIPSGQIVKIRGIQTHTHDAKTVNSGERAALNLPGVGKGIVERGSTLCEPGSSMEVSEFFGVMRTVSNLPVSISNRSKVRVYIGTAERNGQLIWFEENKKLDAGKSWHVRIKLDSALSAAPGDAFLVRLASPVITLAGGQVVEINPLKISHDLQKVSHYFNLLQSGNLTVQVEQLLERFALKGCSAQKLAKKLFVDRATIERELDQLAKKKKVRRISIKGIDHFISDVHFKNLCNQTLSALAEFHQNFPHLPGSNSRELLGLMKLEWVDAEITDDVFRYLLNKQEVKQQHGLLALSSFSMKVSRNTDDLKQEILDAYWESRFAPPDIASLAEKLQVPLHEMRSLCNVLVKEKQLLSIHQQFYLHYKRFVELVDFLRDYFKQNGEMPVAALKDYIQTSRKYAIPLFEYLDGEGYTRRDGDIRNAGFNLE